MKYIVEFLAIAISVIAITILALINVALKSAFILCKILWYFKIKKQWFHILHVVDIAFPDPDKTSNRIYGGSAPFGYKMYFMKYWQEYTYS